MKPLHFVILALAVISFGPLLLIHFALAQVPSPCGYELAQIDVIKADLARATDDRAKLLGALRQREEELAKMKPKEAPPK